METLEREDAPDVARTVQSRRQRSSAPSNLQRDHGTVQEKARPDWRSIPELRVLRSADALYEEFLLRKEENDPKRLAALLYAALKFPEHLSAAEMLNCCAYNRFLTARDSMHMVQALRGFDTALRVTSSGEQRWKIALNRLSLLVLMGVYAGTIRDAGWLLAELPENHPYFPLLCRIMGIAYGHLGRHTLAVVAYERAASCQEFRPGDRDHNLLALVRYALRAGDKAKALQIMAQTRESGTPHHLAVEAEFRLHDGDWLGFIAKARVALAAFPTQPPWSQDRFLIGTLHQQLATVYGHLGMAQLRAKHLAASRVFTISTSEEGLGKVHAEG